MKHKCPVCNSDVENRRCDAIYCSDSCKVLACLMRKKGLEGVKQGENEQEKEGEIANVQ